MADSAFSRYFDVFTARPGSKKAARFGRFAVPGEETLELPEGRVRIYYDENEGNPSDDSGWDHPDDLKVSIASAVTGEEVPIRFKLSFGQSSSEKRHFARAYVGRVEIPSAGSYKVTATVTNPSPRDPHVSLG